jgi:hypothetical protein
MTGIAIDEMFPQVVVVSCAACALAISNNFLERKSG